MTRGCPFCARTAPECLEAFLDCALSDAFLFLASTGQNLFFPPVRGSARFLVGLKGVIATQTVLYAVAEEDIQVVSAAGQVNRTDGATFLLQAGADVFISEFERNAEFVAHSGCKLKNEPWTNAPLT